MGEMLRDIMKKNSDLDTIIDHCTEVMIAAGLCGFTEQVNLLAELIKEFTIQKESNIRTGVLLQQLNSKTMLFAEEHDIPFEPFKGTDK